MTLGIPNSSAYHSCIEVGKLAHVVERNDPKGVMQRTMEAVFVCRTSQHEQCLR